MELIQGNVNDLRKNVLNLEQDVNKIKINKVSCCIKKLENSSREKKSKILGKIIK